jgi:DNA-directed RNA polymerase subunit M/transcription elongation factor TFIIS
LFEFCEKCGSVMPPSKNRGKNLLICNLCNNEKKIREKIENSYIFHKEIENSYNPEPNR